MQPPISVLVVRKSILIWVKTKAIEHQFSEWFGEAFLVSRKLHCVTAGSTLLFSQGVQSHNQAQSKPLWVQSLSLCLLASYSSVCPVSRAGFVQIYKNYDISNPFPECVSRACHSHQQSPVPDVVWMLERVLSNQGSSWFTLLPLLSDYSVTWGISATVKAEEVKVTTYQENVAFRV